MLVCACGHRWCVRPRGEVGVDVPLVLVVRALSVPVHRCRGGAASASLLASLDSALSASLHSGSTSRVYRTSVCVDRERVNSTDT